MTRPELLYPKNKKNKIKFKKSFPRLKKALKPGSLFESRNQKKKKRKKKKTKNLEIERTREEERDLEKMRE